jgi:PadR family transcriptional regulator PadR
MVRSRPPSPQMRKLLEGLAAHAPRSRHGYELMKETGLLSGTLYPLLMRMSDLGLVEAEWEAPAQPGRPPRHAYRLTAAGVQLVRSLSNEGAPDGAACPA